MKLEELRLAGGRSAGPLRDKAVRRALTLRPFAKVNLMLRVGARQPDGYHDVRTVLQAVGIFDTLTFTARRGPFALQSRAPGLATDESNLVWRAAAALWRVAGKPGAPRDAHVKLDKTIPMAAGLGGGSADAAAALVGLNQLWDFRCPPQQLIRLHASSAPTCRSFFRAAPRWAPDEATRYIRWTTSPVLEWSSSSRRSECLPPMPMPGSMPIAHRRPKAPAREPRALDVGWAAIP